jgi:hypothetical protein
MHHFEKRMKADGQLFGKHEKTQIGDILNGKETRKGQKLKQAPGSRREPEVVLLAQRL